MLNGNEYVPTKTLFTCPNCQALCEEGCDADYCIMCANCGQTFSGRTDRQVEMRISLLHSTYKRVTRMNYGCSAYIPC